jgi:ATP-dependent Clp protease, protease subunit
MNQMELKHVTSLDELKKTATLLLYGEIGDKVDGDYFAQEINFLSKQYDEIVIRINSGGGSVLQGLSIFNAMLNSPAFIVVNIDGIAASMAGVIAMAGNIVRMNDLLGLWFTILPCQATRT